ncbi:hypothetical protein IQ270_10505 [Microcoleus sp. LEGE 07076]|uniref:hypothetical protein n=1 Tax=Microcoleus sp. LEGE 07076 TaxID=915322 RepID=UPI001882CC96|nr:hypothetical protein [Microcoleus sp. LEGE 07076]MBE9185135.1 hypothetical protein [Microcoleus sp. LEGE 07076]
MPSPPPALPKHQEQLWARESSPEIFFSHAAGNKKTGFCRMPFSCLGVADRK